MAALCSAYMRQVSRPASRTALIAVVTIRNSVTALGLPWPVSMHKTGSMLQKVH